jgi:hypothetical protein
MSILEIVLIALLIGAVFLMIYTVTEKWLDLRAMKDYEEWLREHQQLEQQRNDRDNR